MAQETMQVPFQVTESWLRAYFAAVDTLDAETIAGHFAPDARFHFGNEPPAAGKAAIAEALSSFFSSIKGMHHQVVDTYIKENAAVFEADVTYARPDGSRVVLPCASILRFKEGLIEDFKMLMDISPVYRQAE